VVLRALTASERHVRTETWAYIGIMGAPGVIGAPCIASVLGITEPGIIPGTAGIGCLGESVCIAGCCVATGGSPGGGIAG